MKVEIDEEIVFNMPQYTSYHTKRLLIKITNLPLADGWVTEWHHLSRKKKREKRKERSRAVSSQDGTGSLLGTETIRKKDRMRVCSLFCLGGSSGHRQLQRQSSRQNSIQTRIVPQ